MTLSIRQLARIFKTYPKSQISLSKIMREMEKEPAKENETWCAYCGKGIKATWDVITEQGRQSVCDDHEFVLRQIKAVVREKKIGEDVWAVIDPNEEVLADHEQEDLGDWKDFLDMTIYEKRR